MHAQSQDTHTSHADFTSSCSFLLGTLKPVHVSLCPSLQTPFFFAPLLLHFMHLYLPSALLPLTLCDNTFFPQYVITYFIMSLRTKWNIAFFSFGTFFSALVASQALILSPVFYMQPCCNTTPNYILINNLWSFFRSISCNNLDVFDLGMFRKINALLTYWWLIYYYTILRQRFSG